MRTASLAVTEEAQKLLRATRADFHRITAPALPGRGGGYASTPLGRYDFEQVRNQSEFLRLVSIVEAFVDTCSAQQFELRTAGRDEFLREMASEVRETSLKGWNARKVAFKRYHGIALGQCACWKDIDAARQIRNSIAHGLGHLTPLQRNASDKRKMESLGVWFRGDRLVIDTPTLERCVESAVTFIQDVDRRLILRT